VDEWGFYPKWIWEKLGYVTGESDLSGEWRGEKLRFAELASR
jgi:hypothetical protein